MLSILFAQACQIFLCPELIHLGELEVFHLTHFLQFPSKELIFHQFVAPFWQQTMNHIIHPIPIPITILVPISTIRIFILHRQFMKKNTTITYLRALGTHKYLKTTTKQFHHIFKTLCIVNLSDDYAFRGFLMKNLLFLVVNSPSHWHIKILHSKIQNSTLNLCFIGIYLLYVVKFQVNPSQLIISTNSRLEV